MRFACRVTKARIHALVIFVTICLSTIKIVTEKHDSVRLHLHCLFCSSLYNFVLVCFRMGYRIISILQIISLQSSSILTSDFHIIFSYRIFVPLFIICVCGRGCSCLLV